MKAYFTQLFNYDKSTNLLMLETIMNAGSPEKPVQLMAHLLSSQQVWLARCKGEPTIDNILWPDWKAETLKEIIDTNHKGWLSFLDSLKPDDLEKIISYKTLKGDSFENRLIDILTHVINHGTHHRAQAGQQLKLAGSDKLPPTDYILYVREANRS
jgi:uncharacterized damage-inducible protein DinB